MAAEKMDADFVVKPNTENPYLEHESVEQGVETAIANHSDYVVVRKLPLGCAADIYSFPALKQSDEQGGDRHHSEFTSRFILDHLDSFQVNTIEPETALQRPEIRLTVDNPSDLMLVRDIWDGLSGDDSESPPSLASIIEYLDSNPDLTALNDDLPDGTDAGIQSERPVMYGEPVPDQ
jgi:spore coat polysaccharide biosynthesis protein SpsF (cytidylyltransferase family)